MSTINKKKSSSNFQITAKLQSFLWKDVQSCIKSNDVQALSTLYSRYPKDTNHVLLNYVADINGQKEKDHASAAVDSRLTNIFSGLKKVNALELAILYNREQIAYRLIDWTTATTTIVRVQHKQPKQHHYDTKSNSTTNQDNNNNNNNRLITPLCDKATSILGWKKAHLFKSSSSSTHAAILQQQQQRKHQEQQEHQEPQVTVNMHTSIFMKKATEKVSRLYCGGPSIQRTDKPLNDPCNDIHNGSGISPSPSPVSLTFSSSSSCSTSSSSSLSSVTSNPRWSPTNTPETTSHSPVNVLINSKQLTKIKDNHNEDFLPKKNDEQTYYQRHRIQHEDGRKEGRNNAALTAVNNRAVSHVDTHSINPSDGIALRKPPTSTPIDAASLVICKKKNKSVQFSTKVILLDACSRGDLDELQYYASLSLSPPLDWNTIRDLQKRSLLHIAIMHRQEHLVPFLIKERRVDIGLLDVDGWTCVHYVAALSLWKTLTFIMSIPKSYDILIRNNVIATAILPRHQPQPVRIEECPETVLGRRKCKAIIQKAFIRFEHSKSSVKNANDFMANSMDMAATAANL